MPDDNHSLAKSTRPITEVKPTNSFCKAISPEMSDMGTNEVSGAYVFDASEKKVFFEIKLVTKRSKEGYSSPVQKILLGFSEDEKWGNDFVISCDTHRHMSAFGQWKVNFLFHFNKIDSFLNFQYL